MSAKGKLTLYFYFNISCTVTALLFIKPFRTNP